MIEGPVEQSLRANRTESDKVRCRLSEQADGMVFLPHCLQNPRIFQTCSLDTVTNYDRFNQLCTKFRISGRDITYPQRPSPLWLSYPIDEYASVHTFSTNGFEIAAVETNNFG